MKKVYTQNDKNRQIKTKQKKKIEKEIITLDDQMKKYSGKMKKD